MVFLLITMIILILAMLITTVKMVMGPTLWDRLLGLNLISIKTILLLTVYAVYTDNLMLLDIAISYGIIGFVTIALISRFITKGGRQK